MSPAADVPVLDLLRSFRARGIEMRCDAGRLRVNAPPGGLDDETRERIAAAKDAILAFLSAPGTKDASARRRVRGAPRAPGDRLPLSHAQQRLWILQQLQPDASVYNLPYAFHIDGRLDVDALRASLASLVRRHEALRTTFGVEQGVPYQTVAPDGASFRVDYTDLRAEPDRLRAILDGAACRPFELAVGPLIRASIFALAETRHVLFFNIHHIVCDGWSIEIFLDELLASYDAFARGARPALPALPLALPDFALWEQENVTAERTADALAFFRAQLAGAPESLELPADRPRPGVFGYRGASLAFTLDRELVEALAALGQRHHATLFMVMLAAYQILLSRLSGQKDLVVGTPVAGRQDGGSEAEGVMGNFINTILLRGDLRDEPTFVELLARVRAGCLSSYEHQALPFEWLVEAMNPARDRSRTALCQTLFTFQDARQRRMERGGLRFTRIEGLDAGGAKTDLTLLLEQHAGADGEPDGSTELRGWLEFSTELFDRPTIERFARDYETLLRSIVAHPEGKVTHLELLHPEERAALRALNATARPLPTAGGFHELIEAQTRKTPAAIAVVDSAETLTYLELERRVNRLANHLLALGVGRGARVGVAVGRNAHMLEATLGILKAGAAYVPLDPDFPAERLELMLEDAGLALVIGESAVRERLPLGPRHPVLWLDGDAAAIEVAPETDPGVRTFATDAAYVIYTSGSTGRPKGVVIPHGAVVNFLVGMAEQPGCTPHDRLVAVTTLSFDIAVLELFLPLTVGARTIIASRNAVTDGARLCRMFEEHEATMMQATPVTWQLVLDAGWTGRAGFKALCGGEAFPAPLARELIARCGAVWNMYGPTETTVWSACQRLESPTGPILIGKPIANTQLHVLDEHRQQVPFGVTGELYIGGHGVASGYLDRPALTAERFVPDPFSGVPGARCYRTGDLARQLPDGVAFIGRADNQIKLRGHRIELGEIEAVLNAEAEVARAAVVVRDFGADDRRIVAYVVGADPSAAVDVDRLRQRARARLPDYMVPQHVVVLDALPLTPNGKIDRKALPTPARASGSPGDGKDAAKVPPANAIEELLVRLWCRTLKVDAVGVTENFFDLGGHSLLAVRLAQLISEACHINLSLGVIFQAPTIREQARAIDQGHEAEGITVVPLHARGEREPLFCICGINLYQHLAHNLDADRPVFGVFLPVEGAVFAGKTIELSVREMAAEYVKAIRSQQPRGPYHLAGVSFGGVLAYETAQQLREAGEEVGVLAILDVVLATGFEHSWVRWTGDQLARLRQQGTTDALARAGKLGERASHWLEGKAPLAPPAVAPWLERLRSVLSSFSAGVQPAPDGGDNLGIFQRIRLDQYRVAWDNYQRAMRPYPGPAVVLRARDEERPAGSRVLPDCGWSRYVAPGKLTLVEIPGDHLGILTEPHVRELTRALRAQFTQFDRRGR